MTARWLCLMAASAIGLAVPATAQNAPPMPPMPPQYGPGVAWQAPPPPGTWVAPGTPGYPVPMAPGYRPGMSEPYPGYTMPPIMWVRVPIEHTGAPCNCQEEQVIEEEVVSSAPPPRPTPRAIPRRPARSKMVRTTR